jgi:signal peptidase I
MRSASRLLERTSDRLPGPARSLLRWAAAIAVAAAVVLACEAEVATPYRVPSASMEPTVHCARPAAGCTAHTAERIIACRICYRVGAPSRGQIVAFHAPAAARAACGEGGVYVKRLIGLPGETVREDARARIWIDGRLLSEPYVSATARTDDTRFRGATWRVPDGRYLMLGDNRGDSCDSRTWGSVARGDLVGPVLATYWPPRRLHVDAHALG